MKSKISQTGTSLRVGYRSRDALQRYILFTASCSQRARQFRTSVTFSVRRTVAELRGLKVAQFSDFGLFSPYKTPKTYLPMTSLLPRSYIAEWFRFFHGSSRSYKGVPSGSEVFLRLLVLGDPQTCPNFRLWQLAISIQNATARRVRSGPKMSENAQF